MNRGRGGFRGGFGGRGGRSGPPIQQGPPDKVFEMGAYLHPCEGDIVCRSINEKIPYFNAPIYLENKTQVGKVDEILGPLNEVFFTIKPSEGVQAKSFKEGDKFYIGGDKLLPVERFLPKPKARWFQFKRWFQRWIWWPWWIQRWFQFQRWIQRWFRWSWWIQRWIWW
ncbi:unnamed protein product [[Candida] boidinii]|nr:unnamed protein product [[Candida] boidinii]